MWVEWSDLSGFQRDVLAVVARLERSDGKQYGLAIKRAVEARYGASINPPRLYQNLDELVAIGLLDKWFYDGRTNRYRLTDDGVRVMQAYAVQMFADLDIDFDGDTDLTLGDVTAGGTDAQDSSDSSDSSDSQEKTDVAEGPDVPDGRDVTEGRDVVDGRDGPVSVSGSAR